MAVSVGEAPKPKTKPSPTKHEPRAQRGDAGAPLRADAGKAQELEP
jgi:hypothetical protein